MLGQQLVERGQVHGAGVCCAVHDGLTQPSLELAQPGIVALVLPVHRLLVVLGAALHHPGAVALHNTVVGLRHLVVLPMRVQSAPGEVVVVEHVDVVVQFAAYAVVVDIDHHVAVRKHLFRPLVAQARHLLSVALAVLGVLLALEGVHERAGFYPALAPEERSIGARQFARARADVLRSLDERLGGSQVVDLVHRARGAGSTMLLLFLGPRGPIQHVAHILTGVGDRLAVGDAHSDTVAAGERCCCI